MILVSVAVDKKEEKKKTVQNPLGEEQVHYIFHAESAIKERQDRSRCQKPGVRNWGCEEAMGWLTYVEIGATGLHPQHPGPPG